MKDTMNNFSQWLTDNQYSKRYTDKMWISLSMSDHKTYSLSQLYQRFLNQVKKKTK